MEGKNYAAFYPCGCMCAVAKVMQKDKKMAREVAKWMSEGLDVRQVSTEEVRNSKWGCEACKPKKESR